ncbi:hypothetical protein ACFSCZ_10065 [Siminovitchia sediminis]|uniref:Uncharacterized protein n=1 Tax=Siminovitchia sediminis TaxID=1274353 RepID=A0ABW4KGC4_9BACI
MLFSYEFLLRAGYPVTYEKTECSDWAAAGACLVPHGFICFLVSAKVPSPLLSRFTAHFYQRWFK